MPPRPLILALGEILWDLLPAGKQLGGAPANFAYHAAQLGADARTVSVIGDDDLGREILARLHTIAIPTTQLFIDPVHPTGTVTVSLTSGEPAYTIHENVAWDFLPCPPELLDRASHADCICFGTLAQRSPATRQTIQALLTYSRPGALRIFDINLRQRYYSREIIETSLKHATVLKINDEELPAIHHLLSDRASPASLFQHFPQLRLIALTRGARGSALYSRDGIVDDHPGEKAQTVADTIGAGDAFTAALAIGLLQNLPLHQINQNANRLAACVCTQNGATPSIPTALREQIKFST